MRAHESRTSDARERRLEVEAALSVRNLALLGRLLCGAALARTESRGAHYRADYPNEDNPRWRAVTRLESGSNGEIEVSAVPVAKSSPPTDEVDSSSAPTTLEVR